MQLSYYSVLNFVAGILALILAIYSWKGKNIHASRLLGWLLFSIAWWDFGIAIEYMFTTIHAHLIWSAITYPGTLCAPVFYFLLIIQYTRSKWWKHPFRFSPLFLIPLISCILAWHPLGNKFIWPIIDLRYTSIGIVAHYEHGPWFWVETSYSYLLMLLGIGALIKNLFEFPKYYSPQTRFLLIASIIPLPGSFLYFLNSSSLQGIDTTSLFLTLSCLCLAVALFRFGLLKVLPIARNTLIDQLKDVLFVLDKNNAIIDMNPAGFQFLQLEKTDKPFGKTAEKVFASFPELYDIAKDSTDINIDIQFSRKPSCIYNLQASRLKHPSGFFIGKMLLLRDITEIHNAGEQIREMNQELRKSNEMKNQLFKIIGHDLRGPMGNMKAMLELITSKKNPDPVYYRQHLESMSRLSGQLFLLIDNLLNWARSQSREIHFKPVQQAIFPIIEQSVELLKPQADLKEISLYFNCPETMEAFFDMPTLMIVLRNLIGNAIKFTGTDGHVLIDADTAGDKVQIHINDTGIGMDQEMAEALFNGDKSFSTPGTSGEKGIGLGIFVCRELIKGNNGKITIMSSPGKGSMVTITIPAKPV